jgi:hypothetical protein
VHTRDLASEEVQLAPPGAVCGVVDVPFEVRSAGSHPLCESFEGALFSIRHQVAVTVARPWYTVPVQTSAPFAVQRVHAIHQPFGDGAARKAGAAAAAAAAAADPAALYGPQALSLEPFTDGATCTFNYDKGWCVWAAWRVLQGGGRASASEASCPMPTTCSVSPGSWRTGRTAISSRCDPAFSSAASALAGACIWAKVYLHKWVRARGQPCNEASV